MIVYYHNYHNYTFKGCNGGPARQQFKQKGEPSEFRQFFQLKIEKSDFHPKMTALASFHPKL